MSINLASLWIRAAAVVLLLVCGTVHAQPAGTAGNPATEAAWQALREGAIVLYRHAQAPGVGDPPSFKLGDCSTQRNLDAAGRDEARRIGAALRDQRVPVTQIWASQWCRTTETAQLIAQALAPASPTSPSSSTPSPRAASLPLAVQPQSAFNSFFQDRKDEPAQTAAARQALLAHQGPGTLVVVTHQVNVSALTGIALGSGEGVVLKRVTKTAVMVPGRPESHGLAVVGRIAAP
jgi:broad specificity phosphatase PhoE